MTLETDAVIAYFKASGVAGQVTDLNSPGVHTSSSYHYRKGSLSPVINSMDHSHGDIGLAVDLSIPGQSDTPGIAAIFQAFEPVESQLTELFHSGPSITYFIKDGKRYPIAQLDAADRAIHHNHTHVAVAKRTFLKPATPNPEDDDMPKPDTRVDACLAPNGGTWTLTYDGGVRATKGAPFYGSFPGLPDSAKQGGPRSFISIEPTPQGGYVIISDNDEGDTYAFNPK